MSIFTHAAALEKEDAAGSTWNRLAMSTPQPDPFCATTHWQLSFREAIDRDRPFLVRQCDDGLVQFARHTMYGRGAALGPIERNWLFGSNLLGPAAPDLLAGLLDELKSDAALASWPLVISGLDPAGAVLADFRRRFDGRYLLQRLLAEVQCAASLDNGLDGYLTRRSANHRKKLRQCARRAGQAGVSFERCSPSSAVEAEAVFERMLAVERASWKGSGRCGMAEPHTSPFYRAMLRRLTRSRDARVIFAIREGVDIGYIFGGVAGGIYRGQQFSFDQSHAELSIGNLLQFEQIRWLCEEGMQRYDMGPLRGPSMSYKHHWTELHFPIEAWAMIPT